MALYHILVILSFTASHLNMITYSTEEGTLPGGTPCNSNSQCYSGQCFTEFKTSGFCAPDGPLNGTFAGGSMCHWDAQCFSNFCYSRTCAPDSRVPGKIAAGGMCLSDSQCYSSFCMEGRCGVEGSAGPDIGAGFLAAGARCEIHEQCYSGFCHGHRCGPDGKRLNVIPSGGMCSHHSQCSSNVCYSDRCSPESYSFWSRGKVSNGGRCEEDYQCRKYTLCLDEICTPIPREKPMEGEISLDPEDYEYEEEQKELAYYGESEDNRPMKKKAGEKCEKDEECFWSVPCVHNRCAPPSPVNKSLIADGGPCLHDLQCASSQCHAEICSVSYGPEWVTGWVAAGSYCRENRHCYSFLCKDGKCSADSYANDPTTRHPYAAEMHANRVAAGGICRVDSDCYSELCIPGNICSADGPQMRTVAAGGYCSMDADCASGYCYYGRCVVGGETPGRVAPGGRCRTSDMCAPGSMCVDGFCKRPKDGLRRAVVAAGSVRLGGGCWNNAQCSIGRCLGRKCRAPAHWTATASRLMQPIIWTMLTSVLVSFIFLMY